MTKLTNELLDHIEHDLFTKYNLVARDYTEQEWERIKNDTSSRQKRWLNITEK